MASSNYFDVGIFKDTLLPSVALHTSVAVGAWGLGRSLDRVIAKNWLWPAGFLINTWFSAIGRRVVFEDMSLDRAWGTMSRPERLILAGVTIWGGRMMYYTIRRSIESGKDDPRYDEAKSKPGFWSEVLIDTFIPEALFQAVIALPFSAPFRHWGMGLTGYHPAIQGLAVGLWTAGFTLEALADFQLDQHKKAGKGHTLCREGVWSIVRHPNYLGDTLVHLSFPLLLYGSDMLALVELLGPVANYIYLRYVGGDKHTEFHQVRRYSINTPQKLVELEDYRTTQNSFWPDVKEFGNKWLWTVVAAGVAGVLVEGGLDGWLFELGSGGGSSE